jgi:hypothetical protein
MIMNKFRKWLAEWIYPEVVREVEKGDRITFKWYSQKGLITGIVDYFTYWGVVMESEKLADNAWIKRNCEWKDIRKVEGKKHWKKPKL